MLREVPFMICRQRESRGIVTVAQLSLTSELSHGGLKRDKLSNVVSTPAEIIIQGTSPFRDPPIEWGLFRK